jgi:hypothetical protein
MRVSSFMVDASKMPANQPPIGSLAADLEYVANSATNREVYRGVIPGGSKVVLVQKCGFYGYELADTDLIERVLSPRLSAVDRKYQHFYVPLDAVRFS